MKYLPEKGILGKSGEFEDSASDLYINQFSGTSNIFDGSPKDKSSSSSKSSDNNFEG